MINRLFVILLLLSMLSCKERASPINGHWKQVDEDNRNSRIVDIEDSVLWVNKNSLTQTYSTKSRIIRERDSAFIAVSNYPSSRYITIRNDTMIFGDGQWEEAHFVRKNVDVESELFLDLEVSIELNEISNVDCQDSIDQSLLVFLNLGKAKRFRTDTVALQVLDTFIVLDDIPQFISSEKMRFNDRDPKSLIIAISIDKSISPEIVNDVIKRIKTCDPKLRIVFPTIDKVNKRVCYSDSLFKY